MQGVVEGVFGDEGGGGGGEGGEGRHGGYCVNVEDFGWRRVDVAFTRILLRHRTAILLVS